jgi:hypothetical protein
VRTTMRALARLQALAPPAKPDHSAEAWIAVYQRKSAIRCVAPAYEDGADAETIRRATRTALLRATDRDAAGRLRWRGP